MNKSMAQGLLVGAIAAVVAGAGAVTGYKAIKGPAHADVVAVSEAYQTVDTPQERCENVLVTRQAPVQDEHRIAGTVLGGLAGGALGRQVGGGSGRDIATVAGAAAGGYAGNQVQKSLQQRDRVTVTERRCRTVVQKSRQLVGYDVTYELKGQQHRVRTGFRPGATLPVKDGAVVLEAPVRAS